MKQMIIEALRRNDYGAKITYDAYTLLVSTVARHRALIKHKGKALALLNTKTMIAFSLDGASPHEKPSFMKHALQQHGFYVPLQNFTSKELVKLFGK